MELGEWIGGWIIENSDTRGSDNRGSTVPKVLPQVFQFTSLPFGLATAPQVFAMIVKEVKLMALTRGIRLHQYLDDWLIRAQSQEKTHMNT